MTSAGFRNSRSWFRQADSDIRIADAVLHRLECMEVGDVGCHVAALCAQALEKSLKGYVLLNGATPAMDHRPDKYLVLLLTENGLLRFREHASHLARLFDPPTRGSIKELFDLTPGGMGKAWDLPNTEYPWLGSDEWKHCPCDHLPFQDTATLQGWFNVAKRVCDKLHQLAIVSERAR
ncbi:MAG: hypothetical protein JW940_39460 [Polyangiaceae bacterium]|nr:hypothetical protein [Polyangiaceae bacterium]